MPGATIIKQNPHCNMNKSTLFGLPLTRKLGAVFNLNNNSNINRISQVYSYSNCNRFAERLDNTDERIGDSLVCENFHQHAPVDFVEYFD